MPPNLECQGYQHNRYAAETAFEWYADSSSFIRILEPFFSRLGRSARLLHLGRGTSDLHKQIRSRGFADITHVDYEPLALAARPEAWAGA
jgi:hypothetical protein